MYRRIGFICALVIPNIIFSAGTSGVRQKPLVACRAGYEYAIILPSEVPKGVPAGTIEVRELFLYTADRSKAIQPYLTQWLASKGNHIKFVREPAVAFPHSREQARMYYTLQALGREDLHQPFFDFVREPGRYDVYHTIRHPAVEAIKEMGVTFAERNGIDPEIFIRTYSSWEVEERVIDAGIDSVRYGVNGTSTLVVNGRYSTSLQRVLATNPARADAKPSPEDYKRLFELLDQLVEQSQEDAMPPRRVAHIASNSG